MWGAHLLCIGANFLGVRDKAQVKTFTSEDRPVVVEATVSGNLQAKIVRIGNDIIRVASLYVREEIVKAVQKVRERLPSDISNEEFITLLHKDERFVMWQQALYRVEGEDPNIPWRYLLIDSPIANAFVSEILPQVSCAKHSWLEEVLLTGLTHCSHAGCCRDFLSQPVCSRTTLKMRRSWQ